MSCNSCENNCVQTLNVVSVPMDVADTNTVDLTLAGSILTADVKHQCEIDSNASGIKLADSFYDQTALPTATIESKEVTDAGYGTATRVTRGLVVRDNCGLSVFLPPEKIHIENGQIIPLLASTAVIPGGSITTPVSATASITNTSAYPMMVYSDIRYNYSVQSLANSGYRYGHDTSVNGGAFTIFETGKESIDNASFRTEADIVHAYDQRTILAPGATYTLAIRGRVSNVAGGANVNFVGGGGVVRLMGWSI